MTNQATFDPFKGYGPKIRNKKKAGDTHGQREHQHPREMHNVRGDLQRRDPETRERGDRARGPAVREVPQPPQGDEPEAAEDGGPVDSPGCPECGNHPLGDDEWDTARGVCECDCHNQQVVGVDDPQWFQRAGEHPWPEKFTRFRPDQLTATDQIIEAFENGARVVMLSAPTGCLAGDTVLTVNRAGKSFRITMAELCHKFHGGTSPIGRGLKRQTAWNPDIGTRIQRAEDGIVRLGWIEDVYESGVKSLYRITTQTGRTIRATGDHRFSTPDGWKKLGVLQVGDRLFVRGKQAAGKDRKPKMNYQQVQGLKGHPHATHRISNSSCRYRVPKHRLVVEADMNGITYDEFVARLRDGESEFTFIDRDLHVHHKDHDHTNNDLENLEVKSAIKHHRDHAVEYKHRHVAQKIVEDEIVSIDYCGQEMTYDIEVADDPHNFIANEFVVHNSGKTLVAEMVRRRLATKSLFVCSGKQLQAQFLNDFPDYARVLQGRSNYPTATMPYPEYTGDDCTGPGCRFCPTRAECPYQHAKVQALTATVSVLNTSYLLAEANTAGTFGEKEVKGRVTRRPFIVVDECDVLESALMAYVEFKVSARLLEDLGLQPPVKAARTKTVQAWIGSLVSALEQRVEMMQDWDENDVMLMRRKRSVTRILEQARGIELGNDEDPDGWGDWIRVYETRWDPKTRSEVDTGSFVLKPVVVNEWGMERLWRHADRWLIMSATIISPDEMADSLGLEREGVPWDVVTMPMPFPKENRPIVMKPVANITYAEAAVEKPKLLAGVAEILDRFSGENILVHTVSYSLTKYLTDELRKEQGKGRWKGRAILAYTNAQERDQAVEAFSRAGGVLLAPSLDRGLDLPDDLCRVVVVAKVPFPALGDRQVSERLRRPGGQVWYGVQVARSLVQMTGRGVRHEEDWATTFILDKQFPRWYREAGRKLLPDWWIEAITSDTK